MPKSKNQKSKLLALRSLLLGETDERHPLTIEQIIDILAEKGISAERKSLYDDFDVLRLNGVEVQKSCTRPTGYFVEDRLFSLPELKLLIDAVQASRFITKKKSEALIKKLEGFTSRHNAAKLQGEVFVTNRVKAMNESIYYIIDSIHAAIAADRMISFVYFEWSMNKERVPKHGGKPYNVSPHALVWDDENYYLVAYDAEAGILKHFRVDKMQSVSQLDFPRKGENMFDRNDIALYSRAVFGMFGGKPEPVKLECDNSLIGVFIDRFGKNVPVTPAGENRFRTTVTVVPSTQFLGWVFSLGSAAKIISPTYVVKSMQEQAEKTALEYR